MQSRRLKLVAVWLVGLVLLYGLIGFFAVPALVKRQLVQYVARDLGHQLAIGTLRFNPFTFAAEATDLELKDKSGAALASFKRAFVNFQASSLYRRTWTFAAVELAAPVVNIEIRSDGTLNFAELLARLRKTPPEPDAGLPRLEIDRIAVTDARLELADMQAGETARLRLEPISFELTELSTLPAERSAYKLTARTVDGEALQWGGDLSLNPMASTGQLAFKGWKAATFTRLLGKRIALQRTSGDIDLTLNYRAAYAQGVPSLEISNASLSLADLSLIAEPGRSPLASAKRIGIAGAHFDLVRRLATIARIELEQPSVRVELDAEGRLNWDAIALHPIAAEASAGTAAPPPASSPSPSEKPAPSASSPLAAAPQSSAAPPAASPKPPAPAAAWTVQIAEARAIQMQFALEDRRPGSERSFVIDRLDLGFSANVRSAATTTMAALEKVSLSALGSSMVRATMQSVMKEPTLTSTRIAWDASAAGTKLTFEGAKLAVAEYGLALNDQSWRLSAATVATDTTTLDFPTEAYRAMRLDFAGLQLQSNSLGGRVGKGSDLIEAGAVSVAAKDFALAVDEPIDARASDVALSLMQVRARDPTLGSELARIGNVHAVVPSVSTRERKVALDTVTLSEGNVVAAVSPEGKLSWDAFLGAFSPSPQNPVTAEKQEPAGGSQPWNVTLKSAALKTFAVVYADQQQRPALTLSLVDINGALRNAASGSAPPADIELRGRIKEGGQFSAAGSVQLQTFASDVKLKLSDISLAPAQQFLARHARLKIVSALASADGRLRYGMPQQAGARLVFEGEVQFNKVDLEETEPAQPFLAFDSLRASQARFSLTPDAVDIPDLRINRLATKLIIAEDQTLNLVKVLRDPAGTAKSSPAPSAAEKPTPGEDAGEPPFPVSVSRIRLDNSVLEFADLSLRPQFSTRMHELQGVITGVSTSRNSFARVELDARVDEFGAAQIRGSMNLFRPRAFTSIDMDFRNIEMASLTPYTAKFAGYRIASGKLSTTLQYRVKNSVLQGDNKVVIDQLQLGERVESPTALDLPLELAIALLKDDNGRIDIGLQVSGSLEDPQFSFAALVWKAIGNLVTRIVTAPFRALARLFGGGGENEALGSIEFDTGTDVLRPPERQKLQTVAEALTKRPQLALTIKPAYSPEGDRAALQSNAARRRILGRAGIKLEPGESPGPLDFGNARIQRAIEEEYMDRFGLPALRDLRASLAKAPAAPAAEGTKPAPAASPAFAAIRLARTMSERLIEAVAVADTDLTALGAKRGSAIADEIKSAKVDPGRVTTAAPRAVEATGGHVVSDLDIALAK